MLLSPEVAKFRSILKDSLYVEKTTDPTVNDDRNQRYIRGSRWINVTSGDEFVCADNTPTTAVWKCTTSGGSGGGYTPHVATADPTVNDDSGDGYAIGQMWVNTATPAIFIATDVTVAAAVWVDVSASGGGGYTPHVATSDPTTGDDSGDGYAIGQMWVNTATPAIFIATDVSVGAAVWVDISSSGGSGYTPHVDTIDPTAGDDSGDGYVIGQMWINTTTPAIFIATDVSVGAAVWVDVSSSGSGGGITWSHPTGNPVTLADGAETTITHPSVYNNEILVSVLEEVVIETVFSPNNMTANNAPSPFVAAASSEYSSGYIAAYAFDSTSNVWSTTGSTVPCWLELDCGSGNDSDCTAYGVVPVSSLNQALNTFELQGWNGSSWVTIDSRSGLSSGWTAGVERKFTCSSPGTAYSKFRIYCTVQNGGGYLAINEVTLYKNVSVYDVCTLGGYGSAQQFGVRRINATTTKVKNISGSTKTVYVNVATSGSGGGGYAPHVDTVDPTVSSDNTAGYAVGQEWINTTTSKVFISVGVDTGAAIWVDVSEVGSSGYDDWHNVHSILTMLTAQLTASRMGFTDGWIDSLTDTTGLNLTNCVGGFSSGAAAATAAAIATPTMTSNTAPSGVASASSSYDTSYAAWKAFNRTNSGSNDAWLTSSIPNISTSSSWQWLKFDFGGSSSPTIQNFNLISRNYDDATNPKTWLLQGSTDDSSWTDLYSVSGDTSWSNPQTKSYTISSPAAYRYYRILIKECTGPTYLAIGGLELRTAANVLVMESIVATCPNTATEFMVDLSASTGSDFTVQIDTGNGSGWQTITMASVVASSTVDQLTGAITTTAGTSVKVKITADSTSRVVYGWSLFWR